MSMHPKNNGKIMNYGTPLTPGVVRTTSDDYFSISPVRSAKRAKSVREAFPPCDIQTGRKRSYLGNRISDRKRSNELYRFTERKDSSLSLSFDSSDSESLPDLSDCNSVSSVQSPVTPTKLRTTNPVFFDISSPTASRDVCLKERNIFSAYMKPHPQPTIFDIPELVYKIVEFVDLQSTVIPQESLFVRRKDVSSNGDQERAMVNCKSSFKESPSGGCLYGLLVVNKLFNRIVKEILGKKLLFSKEENLSVFVKDVHPVLAYMRPQMLVLNRLFQARQDSVEKLAAHIDYSSLEKLEIFMCPRLKPSSLFLQPSLKSFVVTGSKLLDDSCAVRLAKSCPNLEVLDIRACDEITDYGIYQLASKCFQLRSINLGRKRKGHLITDHSVSKLVRNNPNLHTLGVAGCFITDKTIWQLAITCGQRLQRLSINDCLQLTNSSVPAVLLHNMMPNLSVLEIRSLKKLTDLDSVVTFKRRQNAKGISVLIDACETLSCSLKACEKKMDERISHKIFQDLSDWANHSDDDCCYEDLIQSRATEALA